MTGESVCEVVGSDRPGYTNGDIVLAHTGWRTHAAWSGPALRKLDPKQAPITTGLGVLGMPGFTAYSGLYVIGKPKAGETVVVAAASGPVGALVGQLAKMAGARAVGIAGGADKCRYLIEELHFDAAIDHKAAGLSRKARCSLPKGHRRLFRERRRRCLASGAAFAQHLRTRAGVRTDRAIQRRRTICRAQSPSSNHARGAHAGASHLRGFINTEFVAEHYADFLKTVSAGLADGRIRYREDITEGLENAPAASWACCRGRISARR